MFAGWEMPCGAGLVSCIPHSLPGIPRENHGKPDWDTRQLTGIENTFVSDVGLVQHLGRVGGFARTPLVFDSFGSLD